MPTIKTNCPSCGEVDLTPADLGLHAAAADGTAAFYAFDCPGCAQLIRKHADERIVTMLQSAGVSFVSVPATPARLPGFTYDDLLDFHALLATDGWFEQLHGLVEL